MSVAVSAHHVWKRYSLRRFSLRDLASDLWPGNRQRHIELRKPFWALNDVSFHIEPGSTFALVGSNGSGKSTMLKIIAGIMNPTQGSINVPGRMALLSHLGSAFHWELTGRENTFLQGAIYGIPRRQIAAQLESIFAFAQCERFMDVPVKFYSTGMRLRLAFAIATHVDPEILLVDEALAVGDTAFRDRCLERILAFRAAGVTMVIVSHERYLVEQLCDHAVLLDHGKVVTAGTPAEVFNTYEKVIERGEAGGGVSIEGDPDRSPLAVESVTLIDHPGDLDPVLGVDEQLRVRITLVAKRDVQEAVVGAQIAKEWHILHGTRSNRQGVVIKASRGERVELDLAYERLSLSRGSYLLHVLVLEHPLAREPVLRIKRAARFRVTQSEREGMGLVRLPHTWQLSR